MKFGNYYLDQNLSEIENELEDVSELMFSSGLFVKTFEDEKIFKGKKVTFCNNKWNTIIATTNERIYKIFLNTEWSWKKVETKEKKLESEGWILFWNVFNYLVEKYGAANMQKKFHFVWDVEWGNIIYEYVKEGNIINIFFTSKEPFCKLSFLKKIKSLIYYIKVKFIKSTYMILYNPLIESDKDNLRWCWLRAIEWGEWPLFIAQPIVPILFIFFSWWKIIITILLLNWLWALIRYKYTNITLVNLGSLFVYLKWAVSIGVGIYFLVIGNYLLAALAGLWPIITLILQFVSPPTQIGRIQKSLMNKLGYIKKTE